MVKKTSPKKDPHYQREAEKYSNPVPSREWIMQVLAKKGRLLNRQHLLQIFNLENDEQKEALRRRLIAMERDGQIMRNRRGNYALVTKLELIKGRVVGHKDGFGFLIADDGSPDVFLPPQQMRSVFPGDRVLVRIASSLSQAKREGVIVEILERNTQQVVGRYFVTEGVAFIAPSHKQITQDIIIPPGAENNAKPGQVVVAEIIAQPQARRQPLGKIIEILGDHLAPGLETEIAIRSYNLPHEWSDAVLTEVQQYSPQINPKDKEEREDLTALPLVTIDGEDAKDFDDAVFCEKNGRGGWRLIVAIADVSHYVKKKTALDEEALQRGNSVYFPQQVVPMLPEILSNELCSLKPEVERLSVACEMIVNADGKLMRYRFFNAVIRSHARLTYTNVAAALVDDKKTVPSELFPHLQNLFQLYRILQQQRAERGALEFDTVETRIIFGDKRKIEQIVPVIRNDAHRLIEECMLLANVAAAKFLQSRKLPVLYRVHEGPDPEKLKNLRDFLKGFGLKLGGGKKPEPQDYVSLIKRIKGRPDEHVIQTVLLRSLRQAVYLPQNSGHFGLAYPAYTHFTSPIRRYPDLLIHRAIKHILNDRPRSDFSYDMVMMQRFGEHCSMTERRADDATRDAISWLKCEYMQNKVGETFTGVISGVTAFGVFVELKDIYVEGLLHITALKNDYYTYDPAKHRLVGKRSSTIYRLGDSIRVLVARVDLDDKEIDFELVK